MPLYMFHAAVSLVPSADCTVHSGITSVCQYISHTTVIVYLKRLNILSPC